MDGCCSQQRTWCIHSWSCRGNNPFLVLLSRSWERCVESVISPITPEKVEPDLIPLDSNVLYIESECNGSVCDVYNEATNEIEWRRESNKHSIMGVYNPLMQGIEWTTSRFNHCIAGVWNPCLKQIEWQEEWQGGIAGVWNPLLQSVEWQRKFHHGVAGVWNPCLKEVEWEEEWNGGVAGYFDYDKQEVIWHRKWRHGICLVSRDIKTGQYMSSCSNVTDWWDDE